MGAGVGWDLGLGAGVGWDFGMGGGGTRIIFTGLKTKTKTRRSVPDAQTAVWL